MLQKGIVKCEEFKDFTSYICCEEHPLVIVSLRCTSLFCFTNHIRIAFEAVINQILEKLKQGCTVTNDILTYLGSQTTLIANTGYPDPEEHERTADVIEKEWPTFKEDKQLGHIPACVWSDRYEPHIFSDSACMDDLKVKAIKYTKEYNKVLQHNQARVMHHHHKKDRSSGKRIPLPACQGKKRGECKHGFPKTKLLTNKPLLVPTNCH